MNLPPIPGVANVIWADMLAVADATPITGGTCGLYIVAVGGANDGKWFQDSDQSWNAGETPCLGLTHKADGHWYGSVHADCWTDGQGYRIYAVESGNLHIPISESLRCGYIGDVLKWLGQAVTADSNVPEVHVVGLDNAVITAAKLAAACLTIAKFAEDVGTTAYADNPLAKATDKGVTNYDPPTDTEMLAAHTTTDAAITVVDGVVDDILEDTGDLQTNQGDWATASAGLQVDLTKIHGTALTETDGQLAGAFTKFFNVDTPTGTVDSIPDVVAGAAGGLFIAGSNAETTIATALNANIIGDITGDLSGEVGSIGTDGLDADALKADAATQIAAAIMAATADGIPLSTILARLNADAKGKIVRTGDTYVYKLEDDSTTSHTKVLAAGGRNL